jgi:hypothetical protein
MSNVKKKKNSRELRWGKEKKKIEEEENDETRDTIEPGER